MSDKSRRISKIVMWIFLALLVLFVIKSCADFTNCESKGCFISDAKDGDVSDIEANVDGVKARYTIDEDCDFVKTVVSVNDNPEMKTLLEGKSLQCSYYYDDFKEAWVYSLVEDVEDCEGELKEIIGQLLMFT